jgi:hypothetical protein
MESVSRHSRLLAWNAAELRVRQLKLEVPLQYVPHRSPIHAGRYHTHQLYAMTAHPVAHAQELFGRPSENPRFLLNVSVVLGLTDTCRDLVFMDIQTAAASMYDVSHLHLLPPRAGGRLEKVKIPAFRGHLKDAMRRDLPSRHLGNSGAF